MGKILFQNLNTENSYEVFWNYTLSKIRKEKWWYFILGIVSNGLSVIHMFALILSLLKNWGVNIENIHKYNETTHIYIRNKHYFEFKTLRH